MLNNKSKDNRFMFELTGEKPGTPEKEEAEKAEIIRSATPGEPDRPDHIMISYNRESRDVLLAIKSDLEKYGYKVWIDVEDIRVCYMVLCL